eukprot:Clim_evm11s142 gene=Clim_evmTU11s142
MSGTDGTTCQASLEYSNEVTAILEDEVVFLGTRIGASSANHGATLRLTERSGINSTGGKVWSTARALLAYLAAPKTKPPFKSLPDVTIVEVGSGTGWLALQLAANGAKMVIATDIPPALDGVVENVAGNKALIGSAAGHVEPMKLDWMNSESDLALIKDRLLLATDGKRSVPDVILGTDVVFLKTLVDPFIDTLASLCGPLTKLLLCLEPRDGLSFEYFMEQAKQRFRI